MDALHFDNDRGLMTALLALMPVPMLWFLGVDLFLYAHDWPRLKSRLLARVLGLSIPALGLWWVRAARTRESFSKAVLTIALAAVAALLTLNALRPQGTVLSMRTPLMALVVMYGAMPNSLARQFIPPFLFTAGIVAERCLWLTSDGAGDRPSDILILLFVNAVGVVMVQRRVSMEREAAICFQSERNALATAERALAELQTLRGIIPICSHCKKLKAEAGDWKQFEEYVSQHTDVEFSHGICPDCLRLHYPLARRRSGS